MSTNYPGGKDDNSTLPNPTSSSYTNSPSHAGLHDNANDAIKAIETKLGTGSSTPGGSGQLFVSNSAGVSAWQTYSVGGDLMGSLPNPALAGTGVTPGSYGSNTQVPVLTIDSKGRVTAASTTPVSSGGGGSGIASPLTTKGDIWVYSTVDTRLPVGTNGLILTADSTATSGLSWKSAPVTSVNGNTGAITGLLAASNNLSDMANVATARTNLGLGSLATLSTINNGNWSGTALAIGNGGTGQTTQQAAINVLTGTQSAGKYLRSDGTNATLSTIQAADVPTLNQSTTGDAGSVNSNTSGDLMPIGSLLPYAGSSAPTSKWLLCFGQQVSRTTYATLFSAIGTTYGTGDGSTTFNLPDLRGRVIAGADAMGGTAANRLGTGATGGITGSATPGVIGGEQSHTQTQNEMPSHNHAGNSGANFLGGGPGTSAGIPGGGSSWDYWPTTNNTGGGAAMNIVQPTLVLNYIIKVQ